MPSIFVPINPSVVFNNLLAEEFRRWHYTVTLSRLSTLLDQYSDPRSIRFAGIAKRPSANRPGIRGWTSRALERPPLIRYPELWQIYRREKLETTSVFARGVRGLT